LARNLDAAVFSFLFFSFLFYADGSIDPFFKVSWKGQTEQTQVVQNSFDPQYYETFDFRTRLIEPLGYNDMVSIKLYDKDDFPMPDEYCGRCFIPLTEAEVIDMDTLLDDPQKRPDVDTHHWRKLFTEVEGDREGEVLAYLQLIDLSSGGDEVPPPPVITPFKRHAVLEVFALGLRNLKPFNYMPMQCPYMEVEVEGYGGTKSVMKTKTSKKPAPENPNFLEVMRMNVALPKNFVRDKRGMHSTPVGRRQETQRNPLRASLVHRSTGVEHLTQPKHSPWGAHLQARHRTRHQTPPFHFHLS